MKINNFNEEINEYLNSLSDEIPEFIFDYINTKEMKRIDGVGCACGTDWTNLFHHKFFYSNLAHSIGVGLIVWNFTKDKKQTLAGLFHDIAVPTFKHSIDFMNGDYKKQESTEEKTREIIENSQEIMLLLKRDNIKIDEVVNYHIYPIADNDTPRLSADRLEYTFSNGIYFKPLWTLSEIKEFYNDILILENEDNVEEIGFKTLEIAEEFIKRASKIWPCWISNEDKITMQFIADIVKEMNKNNLLTIEDLYTYSEEQIINKIKRCGIPRIEEAFKKFQKADRIYESEKFIENKYCVSIESKRRYVNPLVKVNGKVKRINQVSKEAKYEIDEYLKNSTTKYAYLDFNF